MVNLMFRGVSFGLQSMSEAHKVITNGGDGGSGFGAVDRGLGREIAESKCGRR